MTRNASENRNACVSSLSLPPFSVPVSFSLCDFHPRRHPPPPLRPDEARSGGKEIKRSISVSTVHRRWSQVNRITNRPRDSPETLLPPSLSLFFFIFLHVRPRVCTLITENHRGRDTVKWIAARAGVWEGGVGCVNENPAGQRWGASGLRSVTLTSSLACRGFRGANTPAAASGHA